MERRGTRSAYRLAKSKPSQAILWERGAGSLAVSLSDPRKQQTDTTLRKGQISLPKEVKRYGIEGLARNYRGLAHKYVIVRAWRMMKDGKAASTRR